MAETPAGFLAESTKLINPDGTATVEFRTFLQNLGNFAEALNVAQAALVEAQASAKKAANLSDLANVATARGNLGLTAIATGAPQGPWDTPLGAGDRGTVDGTWTTAVSGVYTQAEVLSIRNQLVQITAAVVQIINDMKSASIFTPP